MLIPVLKSVKAAAKGATLTVQTQAGADAIEAALMFLLLK